MINLISKQRLALRLASLHNQGHKTNLPFEKVKAAHSIISFVTDAAPMLNKDKVFEYAEHLVKASKSL